jgi:hypothetical protein
MPETARVYEAFYINKENGLADEVRDGAIWLRDWPGADEGLLITPVKDQLEYSSVSSVFGDLKAGRRIQLGRREIRPVTWKTYPPRNPSWLGGPVLALWPDQKFLGKLHDDIRVKALCVVPGSMKEVQAWVTATKANDLRSGSRAPGPAALNPVVEQAMLDLTISLNHNNLLLGSIDKAEAITTLQVLHKAGYPLDPENLESWTLAHGWPAEEAARFRKFAENVRRGHRYQVSGFGYRDDIVDYWKQKAASQ